MFATVAIVVVVLVIVVLLAHQFSRTRSMERSIRSYKRQLGTIAEVVEQAAQVRTDPRRMAELALAEDDPINDGPAAAQGSSHQNRERLAAGIGDHVYVSKEGRLVFGDSSLTPVVPPTPPIYEHARRRSHRRAVQAHPIGALRIPGATAAIVVLVVAVAGVVGGVLISRSPSNGAAPVTAPTIPVTHSKTPVQHTRSSHDVRGTTSRLLSSTSTSALFTAPSGTYTVAVFVDGICWFGFQHYENKSGPWLAMATLGGAEPSSYRLSTKGSLAITVGAPSKMTKVVVNGTLLGLPAKRANSYVITLR